MAFLLNRFPRIRPLFFASILLIVASCSGENDKTTPDNPDWVNLPEGFHIGIYADSVQEARGLALGSQDIVFVGTRNTGKIYALRDSDNDHVADQRWLIDENIEKPIGVAFKNGDLFVSAITKILRYPDIENHLDDPPQAEVIYDQLPSEAGHNWRYIAIGPDDKLYIGIGAPCNNCESDPIFTTIVRMNLDGSGFETYATGIRNTVGFDWHPQTGELWFTDNGRDNLGDDLPPDELNHAAQAGLHFGYPYCHGGTIADPDFGNERDCAEFTPPVQNLGPHVAALGMLFYTGNMFPATYKNQIFIAEHGSWNRSTPIGYRVSLVKLAGNESQGYEIFADGFLNNGEVMGRPVDLLQLPDGSLLLSDDSGNRVYRIYYE